LNRNDAKRKEKEKMNTETQRHGEDEQKLNRKDAKRNKKN